MANHTETVLLKVNEKDYEIKLTEKDRKIYANTHVDHFGEITVSDFGGGRDKALSGIQSRITNVLKAKLEDEQREQRKLEPPPVAEGAAPAADPVVTQEPNTD